MKPKTDDCKWKKTENYKKTNENSYIKINDCLDCRLISDIIYRLKTAEVKDKIKLQIETNKTKNWRIKARGNDITEDKEFGWEVNKEERRKIE
jgi:hypothetical protein